MAKACSNCDWFRQYDYSGCASVPDDPQGRCMAIFHADETGARIERYCASSDVCKDHERQQGDARKLRSQLREARGGDAK